MSARTRARARAAVASRAMRLLGMGRAPCLVEDLSGIEKPTAAEHARQIVSDLIRGAGVSISKLSVEGDDEGATATFKVGFAEEGGGGGDGYAVEVSVDGSGAQFSVNGKKVATCGPDNDEYDEAQELVIAKMREASVAATDASYTSEPNHALVRALSGAE